MPAHALRPTAEIVSLTALRGVLASWVVVYHFWNDVLVLFPGADAFSPLARCGHMAVPAFFMLSGFVLAHTYTDNLATLSAHRVFVFLLRRLARIYPVHLVTLLAVGAMVYVSERAGFRLTDAGYTSRDFALNLLVVHTWVPHFSLNWNYPSWSISSEWFAYLLFPFAVSLGTRLGLTARLPAMALAVFGAAGSVGIGLFWRPWPFYELVLVVPTFLAGVVLCWSVRNGEPVTGPAAQWASLALVAVMAACCFVPDASVVVGLLMCLPLLLIAVLARAGAGCHPLWTATTVAFVGEVSYALYMTHTLAQKVAYKLLPSARFADAGVVTRVGVLAVYLALIVACCLATYYLVERPCRRWFRRSARQETGAGTAQPAHAGAGA
ncbi:acyltransferase family protein [Humisphaera borealis]|uniref:Acyltransferase n=1 Tax=Humisphaera borealis TaxID=2807512 RepID=A0A7M2WZ13_9BACT|nr:acyltransferase [Humisphaera borealis]QOV90633.1 acyltransferase [Humisphaera borealis]